MTDLYDFEEDFRMSLDELRQVISGIMELSSGDEGILEPELQAAIDKLPLCAIDLARVHAEGLKSFKDTLDWRLAFSIPERGTTGDIERSLTDSIMDQLVPAVGFVAAREILYDTLIKLEKYYVL